MKTYAPIQTEAVSAITCDCCQVSFTDSDVGWGEMQSIEFVAGYGYIFGDGNTMSVDLCHDCLKQMLGPWLRVSCHRHRKKHTLEELLADAPDRLPHVIGCDDMVPVGREFGADSVRFTRVLQQAIAVFGNPLEAVQWLITSNSLFEGLPMQKAIGSEDDLVRVLGVLADMENAT